MTTQSTAHATSKGFVPNPGLMKWRFVQDKIAAAVVTTGGLSVIFAVVLIFFYLLWVVLPLFKPTDMIETQRYAVPGAIQAKSLLYSVEQQAEVGLRVSSQGTLDFFDVVTGDPLLTHKLAQSLAAATVVSHSAGEIAALSELGRAHIFKHKYKLEYPEGLPRTNTPRVEFPYGEEGIELAPGEHIAARDNDERLTLASSAGHTVSLKRFEKSTSFLDDSISLDEVASVQLNLPGVVDEIIIDPLQQWLYVFNFSNAEIYFYDIRHLPVAKLVQVVSIGPGKQLTAVTMLAGGISIVTATSDGKISQWFPVRDDQGVYSLNRIRGFNAPGNAPVNTLLAEHSRRGFMALDQRGMAGVYYATSEREIMTRQLKAEAWALGTVSPRADVMLLESTDSQVHVLELHNEHPEVSWKALWGKIWYENYPEANYTWQSSASSGDFEPKFSLTPLSFGTLKAAFYAMLFAVPLALGGAIFTAYFMSSQMRQLVKPTIEVMEALPTVILGFLAGLWLAPFVENSLPGVFLTILLLPVAMLMTAWFWQYVPNAVRHRVPTGWQPALLILPIVAAVMIALGLSKPIELMFFDGSMPNWLDNTLGIDFDQRNSLVVGIAMGFAVIPTIFSIAEDAIFSVPKQLTQGSLALGASPWQTLVRVVLPTASPGIFSALMIGMGRAVGETMIVLMATGNTPIMDFNIFEGFRTLSANIAVEMPESEVGSTHFRILFLAGLVLFMFTFVFNTVAEVVRQRLRNKYSSL